MKTWVLEKDDKDAGKGSLRIAVLGNPNSGKTTLFNALTGSSYKVANYPGVTVERREGDLVFNEFWHAQLFDLPGTYSLFGQSPDEVVATSAIAGAGKAGGRIDAVILLLDTTNLERNLFFASQVIDCGLPVVLALSKTDVALKKGIKVYAELLSRHLDLPVIQVLAREGKGIDELKAEVLHVAIEGRKPEKRFRWFPKNEALRRSVAHVAAALPHGFIDDSSESRMLLALALLGEQCPAPSAAVAELVNQERRVLKKDGVDALTCEAQFRYQYVGEIIARCTGQTAAVQGDLSAALDRIATHRIWGLIIFVFLLGILFQLIFTLAAYPMALIEQGMTWLSRVLVIALPDGMLRSFLVNGLIAGVGSVLVFIPQIAIMFFMLTLLEDSGYMARAAYLVDRIMSLFGLQGRSFIPLLNSFACTVPGIMSTRIISSRSSRIATILIAPLMGCSARLPIYTLLIAAFIPEHYLLGIVSAQGLSMFALYVLGIVAASMVALILKWTVNKNREKCIFAMEMPAYHRPSLRLALSEVRDRVRIFFRTAGSIILLCSALFWFLASFPRVPEGTAPTLALEHSYAGVLGKTIEPLLQPLGYDWRQSVALLSSFAAREAFVSTLATVYNVEESGESAEPLVAVLKEKHDSGEFKLATALSLLVFFVLACQCSSTLATCRRETNSWAWTAFLFGYTFALAYAGAFLAYNLALCFE